MNSSALAPGLARKVKKILEIKTESPDLVNALGTLSLFYEDNTPGARRALRATIEQRGLDINQQFLGAAESVIKALDDVQAQLDALAASCSSIQQAVASSKGSTSALLTETDKLGRVLSQVESRRQMVADFLDQYQLSPQEVAALQGDTVGPDFFAALARVRAIHDNCRALLRGHHQRAGLELMDLMASYQEGAYERLCRWVQSECRTIGDYDAPEVDPALTAAVRALRQRPVLFKYCAEEVASSRHAALFQRFIAALTRGGPGGLPRPIEIHSHDPKRYVSDILAWLHQSLASEREFVVAMFGEEGQAEEAGPGTGDRPPPLQQQPADVALARRDSVGSPTHHPPPPGQLLDTAALLDRIFESISRPLRVRVEQVLMMQPPVLLCFQLMQLVAFYQQLVVSMLGEGSGLAATLAACRDAARRAFFEQLRTQGERLLRSPPPPPPDLSPPPQVAQALAQLHELMNAHETALSAAGAAGAAVAAAPSGPAAAEDDASTAEFAPVLEAVLGPLTEMVRLSAEALAPNSPARLDEGLLLDPTAFHAYQINCLGAMQALTALRPFCAPRTAALGAAIGRHLDALVVGEARRLLAACGLVETAERIRLHMQQPNPAPGALAADPALSLHFVAEALRSFFVLVSSPDTLPEFPHLHLPRLRTEAVARVSQQLVEAYELVYGALEDPRSGYVEQGGVRAVKHSPAQVRTILGVI